MIVPTEKRMDMFAEIVQDINDRIKKQPCSMCASADEVRICWLVAEIQELRKKIKEIASK